ncbi:hypothetical protein TWF730_007708 [Orbilia blumenaviensis]|uniref:Uncharacterized protein n=1 Tax=Orbilia blumenaviensis TaxID=1796055 RepID=A0AAV9VAD3_9PEZI
MRFHVLFASYGLGTVFPLVTAYEIAFYPYELSLHSRDSDPLRYRTYPRFKCHKIPMGDPKSQGVQNILVRTAEEAIAPELIVFYNAAEGDPNPCADENGRLAGYFFKNEKPSQQILYTSVGWNMNHFMDAGVDSDEWAALVDWLGLKPGQIAARDPDDPDLEWFEVDEDIEVKQYGDDHGYHTDGDFSYGEDSHGVMAPPKEGVKWPEMEENGTKYAPGQKVHDDAVYMSNYRDWRNARIRFGDYRPLPKEFTDTNTLQELQDMGYIIDIAKEMQMRDQRQKDLHESLALERVYEEDLYRQKKANNKYKDISNEFKAHPSGWNAGSPQQHSEKTFPAGNQYQAFLEDFALGYGSPGFQAQNPYTGLQRVSNMNAGPQGFVQQEGIEIEEELEGDEDYVGRYGAPGLVTGYEADIDPETGTEYVETTQILSSTGQEGMGGPRSPLYDK